MDVNKIISAEIYRLIQKFGKEYLDCEDLMEITGLGRDNVRLMMNKSDFPKIVVGRRHLVSVSSFTAWKMSKELGGLNGQN